jgi:hypothetical protein
MTMKRNETPSNHIRMKTVQFSSSEGFDIMENSRSTTKQSKVASDRYETDLLAEESRKTQILMDRLKLRYYHVAAQVPKIRLKSTLSEQKKTLNLFFNPSLLDNKLFEAKKNFSHSGLTKVVPLYIFSFLLQNKIKLHILFD